MTTRRGPLFIAIAVLLLPLLYVASYLALVIPGETIESRLGPMFGPGPHIRYMISPTDQSILWENYRCGDRYGKLIFFPLEQIDRCMRPQTWNPVCDVQLEIPSYAGIVDSILVEEPEPSHEDP